MTIGLGTGSTARFALLAIGERIAAERLQILGVPTSRGSAQMAHEHGIPLAPIDSVHRIDLTIDGADEVGPGLSLIKGGGGALFREKMVASLSSEMIVICDETKPRPVLGAFPLPVAVIPFGWQHTAARLEQLGGQAILRKEDGSPYITDDGLYIVDLHLGHIDDPPRTECSIRAIVGVAEVGLFIGMASRAVIAYSDGRIEERTP